MDVTLAVDAALPRGIRRPLPGPAVGFGGLFVGKETEAERSPEFESGLRGIGDLEVGRGDDNRLMDSSPS